MTIRRTAPIVLLLVVGCGFLKRPDNRFYSLDTLPPQSAPVAMRGTPIGIDGIELPPGLDQRGIVIRGADHRVEVRGTHQWTTSLEEMVIHTLAFDLANRLPDGMVILPGQAKPAGAMRSVYVVFEELAPGPDGVFLLDARWNVIATDPARPEATHHERIPITLESMSSEHIAAGMSQALATLADRMVAQLALGPPR